MEKRKVPQEDQDYHFLAERGMRNGELLPTHLFIDHQ